MRFYIETYREDLVERFEYRGLEPFSPEEAREVIRTLASAGRCFFGILDEEVVGVAGFVPDRWGNASVWGLFNPEIRKVLKQVIREIAGALKYSPYKTVFTVVPCNEKAMRFADMFLFRSGVLPGYGRDGSMYVVYYATKEEIKRCWA